MTLGAIEALRAVGEVLFFPIADIDGAWLKDAIGVRKVHDLRREYRDGDIDEDNYERVVARVIAGATEHGTCALLVPGHPRMGVTLTSMLTEPQRHPPASIAVVDGVSSLDTMFTDLRRDPLEWGSVVLDVNRLLRSRVALNPRLDHYIYHVCSIGTHRTHQSEPLRDSDWHALADHLSRYYEPHQPLALVESRPAGPAATHWATLRTYGELLNFVTFSTTLFLPADRARP